MQGLLFGVIKELVRTPITEGPYRGMQAAPTFEYYEFPEGVSMTRHLKELCERVLPHFPAGALVTVRVLGATLVLLALMVATGGDRVHASHQPVGRYRALPHHPIR